MLNSEKTCRICEKTLAAKKFAAKQLLKAKPACMACSKKRAEMAAIAAVLEAAGHETFLPQRDGFELAPLQRHFEGDGLSRERAAELLHRSIFDLDIYHLLRWSDACVANFNGRVPDDGTVVEAALTWGAGRPLVIYKADERSSFDGLDNPMLTCLTQLPAAVAGIAQDKSG